jgi:hypothetical protein
MIIAACLASADPTPITIYDGPFPGSVCSGVACVNTDKDVIGSRSYFDIQEIELSIGLTSTVTVFTNYDHHTWDPNDPLASLAPWNDAGLWLNIGDLLFKFGDFAYGIPLYDHGQFKHGELYKIGGTTITRTAWNVLGFPSYPKTGNQGWIFRDTEVVWLGGSAASIAQGQETVARGAPNDANYRITLQFTSNVFWNDVVAHGGHMGVQFASATCANDIIKGDILTPVPEPGTALLLAAGVIVLLGCRRKWSLPSVPKRTAESTE